MMFVVRGLQEVRRKVGVSLHMCFIDLQKAYDTVHRTLLWQVLTRIGIPPQMIAAIRQFHDGMRACVRPDDGVCSDWFEVEQGLRQGCVLSPLLFNIFFAAVLNVVLQRFSEEPAILAELVHLKEPSTSMGPESRSTIGGGRGCNKLVPVLGGDGTRMAPPGDLFDQSPREMS